MAPRTFWKGYLKLSLVTCPVAMQPATTDSERVRFHTLNRGTGNRVTAQLVDEVTGKVVEDEDQVKGYPVSEDRLIQIEEEEFDAVALDTTHTIDIEQFVPADSIDRIWFDRPHYLMPDDPVGEEAFAVIREAMKATKTVGISRLVLYRRERAVMLAPQERGMILWTLRYGDEVRDPANYFDGLKAPSTKGDLQTMAETVIAERTKPWKGSAIDDTVQEQLLAVIEAKKKGRKPPKAPAPERPSAQVINIMDALRKSLASDKRGRSAR